MRQISGTAALKRFSKVIFMIGNLAMVCRRSFVPTRAMTPVPKQAQSFWVSNAPPWPVNEKNHLRLVKWNEGVRHCRQAYQAVQTRCFPLPATLFLEYEIRQAYLEKGLSLEKVERRDWPDPMVVEARLQALLEKGFQTHINQLKQALGGTGTSLAQLAKILFKHTRRWKLSLERYQAHLQTLVRIAVFDLEIPGRLSALEQGSDIFLAQYLVYQPGWRDPKKMPLTPLLDSLEDIFRGGHGMLGWLPGQDVNTDAEAAIFLSDPHAPLKTLFQALQFFDHELGRFSDGYLGNFHLRAACAWDGFHSLKNELKVQFKVEGHRLFLSENYHLTKLVRGEGAHTAQMRTPPGMALEEMWKGTEPWCRSPVARHNVTQCIRDMHSHVLASIQSCNRLAHFEPAGIAFQANELKIIDWWKQFVVEDLCGYMRSHSGREATIFYPRGGVSIPNARATYPRKLLWLSKRCQWMEKMQISFRQNNPEWLTLGRAKVSSEQLQVWTDLVSAIGDNLKQAAIHGSAYPDYEMSNEKIEEVVQLAWSKVAQLQKTFFVRYQSGQAALGLNQLAWEVVNALYQPCVLNGASTEQDEEGPWRQICSIALFNLAERKAELAGEKPKPKPQMNTHYGAQLVCHDFIGRQGEFGVVERSQGETVPPRGPISRFFSNLF